MSNIKPSVMTILYADDDFDDREILFEALQEIDPTIKCFGLDNGKQAIDFLHSGPNIPDYIFLDINMPIMDGRTCLSFLKSNPALCSIPVVIYSTTVHREEMSALYKLGASIVIQKPSNLNQLRNTLPVLLKMMKNAKETDGQLSQQKIGVH